MGYELHITRAEKWFESEEKPVTLDEWKAYVEADPEMRMDGFAEAHVDGKVLRYEHEGLAVWLQYSGHDVDGGRAWFDHRSGEITVKHPDDEVIGKMKEIAAALGAKVVGDDNEGY